MEACDTYKTVQTGAFADEADFCRWVGETQKSLVRFCRQMVRDWSEAEDMAQEAYLRAWDKRASFKGRCALLTWQMAIARRVCLDHLRGRKRAAIVPLTECGAVNEPDADSRADVRRALEQLCADDRLILYLRVQEALPFEEIGRAMGKSAAACRKRYERAKQRFEDAYGDRED